jgi:small subunit ribosomal protein S17
MNTTTTPITTVAKSTKRILKGKVVSDKMTDTIVVLVERYIKLPKYEKFVTRTKRYKAHDAGNTKKIGDIVSIEECRPMSKDKRFKVIS